MRHCVNSSLALAIVVGFCSILGTEAQATFLYGQTLSFEIKDTITNPPSTYGPIQFVVNNSIELGVNTSPAVPVNIEVDDTSITFTYTQSGGFNNASFNGYIFSAISPSLEPFGSITIDPATTLVGFNASYLSFDPKNFYINVAGLSESAGTILKLDVAPLSTVPEPSSLTLCGIAGLIVLGINRHRRGRSLPNNHPC